MTAVFTVQLRCADHDRCKNTYPAEPVTGSAKALRLAAGKSGWEVMHGAHGQDVCPTCRVKMIQQAARRAEQGEPLPEEEKP